MTRILLTVASFLIIGSLAFAQEQTPPKEEKPAQEQPKAEEKPAGEKIEPVAILTTTQGDITIRFFPDKAPEHVKNFIEHSKSGFYDKTYFHRVSPTFMIQGGDPNTKDDNPDNDGLGGHSYKGLGTKLKAEFNDMPHVRGILSMARSNQPDSAGSQFFIITKDSRFLDKKYTAFGEVIAGMDAVDKIANQPGKKGRDGTCNPEKHQYIEKIRIEEWPVSKIEETKKASAAKQ